MSNEHRKLAGHARAFEWWQAATPDAREAMLELIQSQTCVRCERLGTDENPIANNSDMCVQCESTLAVAWKRLLKTAPGDGKTS